MDWCQALGLKQQTLGFGHSNENNAMLVKQDEWYLEVSLKIIEIIIYDLDSCQILA